MNPMMKSITQNLFKRLRYMVLSEGSRVLTTATENPIVLGLWSSYKVLSLVDSFDPCHHLLYTFQDVSNYYSNAVSEVAAASHVGRSIDPEIDQLGYFKQL